MASQHPTTGNSSWSSRTQLQTQLQQARSRLRRLDAQTRSVTRDYPLGAFVAALAAGFCLARIASRY